MTARYHCVCVCRCFSLLLSILIFFYVYISKIMRKFATALMSLFFSRLYWCDVNSVYASLFMAFVIDFALKTCVWLSVNIQFFIICGGKKNLLNKYGSYLDK